MAVYKSAEDYLKKTLMLKTNRIKSDSEILHMR